MVETKTINMTLFSNAEKYVKLNSKDIEKMSIKQKSELLNKIDSILEFLKTKEKIFSLKKTETNPAFLMKASDPEAILKQFMAAGKENTPLQRAVSLSTAILRFLATMKILKNTNLVLKSLRTTNPNLSLQTPVLETTDAIYNFYIPFFRDITLLNGVEVEYKTHSDGEKEIIDDMTFNLEGCFDKYISEFEKLKEIIFQE